MFTGIIEEVGKVKNIANKGNALELTIEAKGITAKLQMGDSVAVNGVCLTVTDFSDSYFKADVSPETFKITTFKFLKVNDNVNLELALTLTKPLGGHIVSGHIDGISKIIRKIFIKEFIKIMFQVPHNLRKYMIQKGSIAIDGISLTINEVTDREFSVMIIPHTLEKTTLGFKKEGDYVNIEADIIGKYVENFMLFGKEEKNDITIEFLKKHGF